MERIFVSLITGLLTLLLSPVTLGDSQLYKYTDDNGRVHYTDRPPADRQVETLDIEIQSNAGQARVTDYAALLSFAETGNNVTIYTTDWCRVCKKAKRYMDSEDIQYTEHDIEKSRKARHEFDRLGGKGVPVILVGKQKMHGFSAQKLDSMIAGQ
ncbi:MAG: glutaredoxin family protein [Gammaproteobacteria bacterium]|nr:glutaredoxin family protein [Gammaproteobacteria bacterium]